MKLVTLYHYTCMTFRETMKAPPIIKSADIQQEHYDFKKSIDLKSRPPLPPPQPPGI